MRRMRTMRKSVVLLLFSTCGLVMVDDVSHWKTSGDVGTSSEQIACARKCVAEGAKVCAVLEPDGTCSCDRPDKNIPTNTYMARQGPKVPEIKSIILPFTSTANNFKSLGTENVSVTVVGSPMEFTQDGPSGFPVEQKVLHLQATGSSRHLKYSIPQSLIDSALAEGYIISSWVNFTAITSEIIWVFHDGIGSHGLRFGQNPAEYVYAVSLGVITQYPLSSGWHHYAFVFSNSTGITELFQDGASKGTRTGDPALRTELYFGHIPGGTLQVSAAIYCFTMQTLGQKTVDEITTAVQEARNLCQNI